MADAKQNKNQQEKNPSSEGFGFKQSPLGFDKNEVNLYINKLKKQMKEQQEEFEQRLSNMRKNLETAHDESNAAKAAARDAQAAIDPAVIAAANRDKAELAETQKLVEEMKKSNDAKVLELRKLVLDERRNVAKLDKECAMAQMSEKKIREEYAKLKEKYLAAKKSGSGAKAVLNSNADEVLDEACKISEEMIAEAKNYAKKTSEEIDAYKKKVEAELKARSEKLNAAKKSLDSQKAKLEAENKAAKESMKKISEKIAAVIGQLGSFASGFDSVNAQIAAVTGQLGSFASGFDSVNAQIAAVTGQINNVTGAFGSVTKSISDAADKLDGFAEQFSGVSKQLSGAKTEFEGISGSIEAAKNGFAEVGKTVEATKNSIASLRGSAAEAEKLTASTKNGIASIQSGAAEAEKLTAAPSDTDLTAFGEVVGAIDAASAEINIELKLPTLDESKFSAEKIAELKGKLKVETTYVGGDEAEDEDEDDDIISSMELHDIPSEEPTDEELMADIEHLTPDAQPEMPINAEPEEVKEVVPLKKEEPKAEITDDFESLFVSPSDGDDMSASVPLVNSSGVGAVDDFTLEKKPETAPDFNIEPNDLTAAPDKGSDLGADIFNMVINPDDSAGDMDELVLTPADAGSGKSAKKSAISDDFGEFADLFAAGSAETTAPAQKKKPASFRKPANKSDDMWNFGSDGDGDDNDMSSDSDLSDLLL